MNREKNPQKNKGWKTDHEVRKSKMQAVNAQQRKSGKIDLRSLEDYK